MENCYSNGLLAVKFSVNYSLLLFNTLLLFFPSVKSLDSSQSSTTMAQKSNEVINSPLQNLDSVLDEMNYKIRPGVNGPPVEVSCSVYVIGITAISAVHMDYTIDLCLHEKWNDNRLMYQTKASPQRPLVLDSKLMGKIWNPDLSFPFEKHASLHRVPYPNKVLRIYPNGTVTYSTRLTLQMSCPMDLSAFPMDRQVCVLQLESFTYERFDVLLKWSEDPIHIRPGFNLPRYKLKDLKPIQCVDSVYKLGDFSCLAIRFHVVREYGYFLLQAYIPSIVIITIAWISFWIDKDSAPARTSLGIGVVLTMVSQMSGSKSYHTPVSYLKAIDVWTTSCLVFTVAALAEYAVVNVLSQRNRKDCKGQKDIEKKLTRKTDNPDEDEGGEDDEDYNLADIVDRSARIIYPLAFIVFNAFYWGYYTIVNDGHE